MSKATNMAGVVGLMTVSFVGAQFLDQHSPMAHARTVLVPCTKANAAQALVEGGTATLASGASVRKSADGWCIEK